MKKNFLDIGSFVVLVVAAVVVVVVDVVCAPTDSLCEASIGSEGSLSMFR